MVNLNLIKNSELFQGIGEESIKRMISCSGARIKSYKEGQIIFHEGENPEAVYLLLSGQVMVVKGYPSGRRNLFYEVSRGDVFGELFQEEKEGQNWYDAVAGSDCQVLVLPWNFFGNFCSRCCEHHRKLTRNMLNLQAKKNLTLMKKLHVLAAATLEEKIALFLLERADGDGWAEIRMNREEMADFLGVARPSLSRTLMKMKREGLILPENKRIRILDFDRMEALCLDL